MFKFTERGLEVFGGINELTDEDRMELSIDIAQKTALPSMLKVNGVWLQRSSMGMMDGGYRIHEEDEYDPITAAAQAIEEASSWEQLQPT